MMNPVNKFDYKFMHKRNNLNSKDSLSRSEDQFSYEKYEQESRDVYKQTSINLDKVLEQGNL